MRRLPFLMLLVLLPVPAQADRHKVKLTIGVSTEKSLAARLSFGVRLWCKEYGPDSAPQEVADGRNGTARLPAATDMRAEPAGGNRGTEVATRSLFLFAEAAEYITGRDSGHWLDGWMLGLRYRLRGQSRLEPFFHAMGGRQRPSRRNTITPGDDAATDWSGAAAVGAGVDLEINQSEKAVIVPALRLQLDLVDSGATRGVHPYGRATFGVSFRYEKHASQK